jgi:hypothetical protein
MPDGKEISIGKVCISMSIGDKPNDIPEQLNCVSLLCVTVVDVDVTIWWLRGIGTGQWEIHRKLSSQHSP